MAYCDGRKMTSSSPLPSTSTRTVCMALCPWVPPHPHSMMRMSNGKLQQMLPCPVSLQQSVASLGTLSSPSRILNTQKPLLLHRRGTLHVSRWQIWQMNLLCTKPLRRTPCQRRRGGGGGHVVDYESAQRRFSIVCSELLSGQVPGSMFQIL